MKEVDSNGNTYFYEYDSNGNIVIGEKIISNLGEGVFQYITQNRLYGIFAEDNN